MKIGLSKQYNSEKGWIIYLRAILVICFGMFEVSLWPLGLIYLPKIQTLILILRGGRYIKFPKFSILRTSIFFISFICFLLLLLFQSLNIIYEAIIQISVNLPNIYKFCRNFYPTTRRISAQKG